MRVILGLPSAAKTMGKESCNLTQGQEMEMSGVAMNRKENQKCGDCVSASWRRAPAEGPDDDCSMQGPMSNEADRQPCLQACYPEQESSKVPEKQKRHRHSSTSSHPGERDSLLGCIVPPNPNHDSDVAGPETVPVNSLMVRINRTESPVEDNSDCPALLQEQCPVTKCPLQDTFNKYSLESSTELSATSPQHSSAMMSSPFLPSLLSKNLNATCSKQPVSPSMSPSLPPLSTDHSMYAHPAPPQPVHKCRGNVHQVTGLDSVQGAGRAPLACIGDAEECIVILNMNESQESWEPRDSRMEHCLKRCSYQGPNGISCRSITSIGSQGSDGPMCRICHEGPLSDEDLIAPCRCSGTLTYQHRKCLEQWLQTRGQDACELCDFHFTTERKGRPFSEWLREPERLRDRRNILTDCSCFMLLTPLVCVSTWLCLNGAYHYLNFYEGRGWEGIGLITLATVLILIYLFWSLMSLRYHGIIWRTWRQEHQRVHVVMATKDQENNNALSANPMGWQPDNITRPQPSGKSPSSESFQSSSPQAPQTSPTRV